MLRLTRYLTKNYDTPDGHKLSVYEKGGGYQQAKRALGMTREALVEEMKAANIRGRGGAGFPMGVKWSFMPWPPKPEASQMRGDNSPSCGIRCNELPSRPDQMCSISMPPSCG